MLGHSPQLQLPQPPVQGLPLAPMFPQEGTDQDQRLIGETKESQTLLRVIGELKEFKILHRVIGERKELKALLRVIGELEEFQTLLRVLGELMKILNQELTLKTYPMLMIG